MLAYSLASYCFFCNPQSSPLARSVLNSLSSWIPPASCILTLNLVIFANSSSLSLINLVSNPPLVEGMNITVLLEFFLLLATYLWASQALFVTCLVSVPILLGHHLLQAEQLWTYSNNNIVSSLYSPVKLPARVWPKYRFRGFFLLNYCTAYM